ncbi:MAG: amidohydrolase family protein, partial [Chitinophagaceae bacterium]
VSHIKIANREFWGQSNQVIDLLNKARNEGIDITADIYPYAHWHSTLRVLFPDRDYENINSAEIAVQKLFDPNESTLIEFAPFPHFKGMTISEIAKERGESPSKTLIALVQKAAAYKEAHPESNGSIEAIAGKSMFESDIINFMKWPHTNICSDGNGGGHPRGYGAFTRFLGKYVREQKIMSTHEAVHKMTGLTANHLGLTKRGTIAKDHFADLVLLDDNKVNDNATFQNSHALSDGIDIVWVNGQIVYQGKKCTSLRPGKLIKRNE